jgi:hypothetical protein
MPGRVRIFDASFANGGAVPAITAVQLTKIRWGNPSSN